VPWEARVTTSVTEYIVTPTSIGCMVMAAITLFTGGFHLAIFASRTRERINLVFALLCVSIAAYDIFCTGLYESSTVTEGMAWQRLQLWAISICSILVTWFVFILIERPIQIVFHCIVSWFLGLQALSLIVPAEFSLTPDRPSIKHAAIPGVLSITYHEVELGPIHVLGLVSCVAVYAYLLVLLIEYYRRTARAGTLWMIGSQCAFFVGVINDALVGAGVYQFVYVSEYVFFAIVLAMSGVLLSEFVRARAAIEQMNEVLDRRVMERTHELEMASEVTARTLADLRQKDDRLLANIEEARLFQEKTLPHLPPRADLGFHYQPLEVVSGDTFDICELGPSRLRIFLADVTGHGVQAAMRTTLLKTEYDRLKNAYADPARLLEALNRRLVELFPDGELMSTAVCLDVTLDGQGARGTLANAGGPDPLVCGRAGVSELRAEGSYLGLPQDHWQPARHFSIDAGHAIVVYTDGLSEQFNPSRQRFDPVRAANTLPMSASANDLVKSLVASFHAFRESVAVSDDLTVIALRVPGSTLPGASSGPRSPL
jgi:serine phosphatase RsbU (regulator of sigma subunit)